MEPGLKLVITLRFLATGDSYHSLEYSFRVAHNTIAKFVPEVCNAIYEEYKQELFTLPASVDEWKEVAKQFASRWNFHHTCGAIDGKHVAIKKPRQSGSLYYNYKGYFSIILLGVVDGNYSFLWCKVGANGSASDAGVFNQSTLRRALETNRIGLPPPEPLPGDDRDLPYFFVGDDAFPLREWMMKPFSRRTMSHRERVFNYRTSRARRVVENAFGILAHRWRCLLTTLQICPVKATTVVQGCFTLHNYLRKRRPGVQAPDLDQEDDMGNVVPGAWRQGVQMADPNPVVGQRVTREGKRLRNYLADYYCSDIGRLPWQDRVI